MSAFMQSDKLDEQLMTMARMAENCERYEDMVCFVRARVTQFPDKILSAEERNLLSVAYKNVIGSRHQSYRALTAELDMLEHAGGDNTEVAAGIQKFRSCVQEEHKTICHDIIELLKNVLIEKAGTECSNEQESAEEKVFYLKMAGDYYRYLTESVQADEYKENTQKYYETAFEAAQVLAPTHPIRLGLALNFSVCLFEILNKRPEACAMAKLAFDDAISKLDHLGESDYKDSTLIMQLLRDNLTLWSSSSGDAEEEDA
jgi:hypothetical protein